ncbi:MAG: hypothetical protein R2864_04685, partial [Syntrophotaleaceae bacterium]
MVKQTILRTSWLVLFVVFFMLSGCGGGGGGGSDSSSSGVGTAGVAVDPYIKGAVFEEVSPEGVVLQTSTASDATGSFSFAKAVKDDSIIRIKEGYKGTHVGKPYEGSLRGTIEASGNLVVSPITTLLANGFTNEQVIALLEQAGISGLQESDLYADSMADLVGKQVFSDDELILLQANIAVNNFLVRIDNFSWGPNDAGDVDLLAETVDMVQHCLNWNRYQSVRDELNTTLADFTEPLTADHLIGAATILVETVTLRARDGDIADPVAEAEALDGSLAELALHYYVQENRGDVAIEEAVSYGILPDISANQYPHVDPAGDISIYTEA